MSLETGVHVISNGRIGVHWPKTERLQQRFTEAIASSGDADSQLLDLLTDQQQPVDAALPETGVGIELERLLAPVFVRGSAQYGTRASTLAYARDGGSAFVCERLFGSEARIDGESAWRSVTSSQGWSPL